MKTKNSMILAVAFIASGAMEQVFGGGFEPFKQEQQQAKSGVVELGTDDDLSVAAVAEVTPLRASAGALAVEALRAKESSGVAIIKLTNSLTGRKVRIADAGEMAGAFTAADAVSGTDVAAILTFDNSAINNDSVSNSVSNGTGLSTAINAAIATRKPSFSLQALINTIEDIVLDDETKDALVFVDQTNNVIKVLTGVPAQIAAADTAASNELASQTEFNVDVTPASTATKLLGE